MYSNKVYRVTIFMLHTYLVQRFHADDEESLVDGVYLNEEGLTLITQLFKVR